MEVALAIFSVLDHNNSGHVKTSELKETLLGMDAGLRPEDIDDTMLLFDKNRHAPRADRVGGGLPRGGRA